MGALGNALFVLAGPLSTFSAGVVNISIDLSHVATALAAIFSGPLAGLFTGLIVGLAPGLWFSTASGPIALLFVPLGKALTGLTIGILQKLLRIQEREHRSLFTMMTVLVGYIPEMLFTVVYFLVLVPYFTGWLVASMIVLSILVKGWFELALVGVLSGSLMGNVSFAGFIARHFTVQGMKRSSKTSTLHNRDVVNNS